jgi:uncharacterized protein YndB with AHSA1/START domain
MYSTRVRQHVNAPRAAVFRALMDADAIARWRAPAGMTAHVHELEPREGGRFRVSLTYDGSGGVGKSAPRTDTYHGRFTRVVVDEEVVEVLEFETSSPGLQGEMTITTSLEDAAGGTTVLMVHDGVPDAVNHEDNETGMRMALANLARLVEGETASR